jgi:hypothetical protein
MAREMHGTLAQSFRDWAFNSRRSNEAASDTRTKCAANWKPRGKWSGMGGKFSSLLMNLRAELERGSLAEALPEIARQITAGTGIDVLRSAATGDG